MPDEEFINNGIKTVTAKPLAGRSVWYFIQSVKEPVGSPALLPAWQTEGTTTLGGDTADEQTKQGRIVAKTTDEHSIELTQYYAPGDTSIQVIKEAKEKGDYVKVWRVEVLDSLGVEEGDHKAYPAMFGYGLPDELELSDGDDFVEASYTLNIAGTLKTGTFPLTDEDIDMLNAIYDFERPGETTGNFDDRGDDTTTTTTSTTEGTTTTTKPTTTTTTTQG
ncbi:phage major tail protein, TP901-1 family [Listeria grayi]|uniref:phage major tail protein, TP901-1 family n=1 Tax=Listeria grayi TaxID=1641 RepID=UPI0016280636|nr:phage major tail protein, TP901-1 family [Listeria grayi]MBC1921978.1 phage major tail protein, TP901-1 family [Listeria grayi]